MKKSAMLATAIGLAVLASSPARAADPKRPWNDEVGQWFVSPFVGETFTDSERMLNNDLHYGASIGKHLTDKWTAEIAGHDGDFNHDSHGSADGSLSGVSFDLMRVFARDSRVSPYILGGLGMQSTNYVGTKDDNNVTAALGLGLLWDLARSADGSRTVQLRPEVRARYDLQSGTNRLDTVAQIGISFGWGPAIPEPVVEAPPPAKCGDEDNATDECRQENRRVMLIRTDSGM